MTTLHRDLLEFIGFYTCSSLDLEFIEAFEIDYDPLNNASIFLCFRNTYFRLCEATRLSSQTLADDNDLFLDLFIKSAHRYDLALKAEEKVALCTFFQAVAKTAWWHSNVADELGRHLWHQSSRTMLYMGPYLDGLFFSE